MGSNLVCGKVKNARDISSAVFGLNKKALV